MTQPAPYQPTRPQRRCKHPKWVEIYKSRWTGAVDERCTMCGILRTTGGLLDFKLL